MAWELIQANCVGANGAAIGHGELFIEGGLLTKIYVEGDNAPATIDIALKEQIPNGDAITLLTLTNIAAPYTAAPQVATVTNAGALSGAYAYQAVGGQLHIDVTGANAGLVNVWVQVLIF